MKNIRIFLSDFFHFLVVKFSLYLNRHVFVMFANEPRHVKGAVKTYANTNGSGEHAHPRRFRKNLCCSLV